MAVKAITIEDKVVEDALSDIKKTVDEHDKILIRGNGSPSIQEDVHMLKAYVSEQKGWFKAIALLFAAQFVAAFFAMMYLLIQVTPILEQLAVR